jgi:hypothetical protein
MPSDRILREESKWASVMAKDDKQRLCVPLTVFPSAPHTDFPVDVYLPRIVELALYSSSRKIKIHACEMLHASLSLVVGYMWNDLSNRHMIRQQAAIEGTSAKTAWFEAFSLCIPVALRLAADPDPVPKQLFSTLCSQIARLLSGQTALEESTVMFEAVWDMMTGTNPSARSVAAEIAAVLFQWILKHSGAKSTQRPKLLNHVMSVFCADCRHSSPFRRLGASLFWNSIYRYFREDDDLVSSFILQCTHSMVLNLRMSEAGTGGAVGSVAAASAALGHCSRVLMRAAQPLLLPRSDRSLQSPITLSELTAWLFLHLSIPETQARRKVMDLFQLCASQLTKSAHQDAAVVWAQAVGSNTRAVVLGLERYVIPEDFTVEFSGRTSPDIFAGRLFAHAGRIEHEDAEFDEEHFPLLNGVLDYFAWLIQQRVITSAELTDTSPHVGPKRARSKPQHSGSSIFRSLVVRIVAAISFIHATSTTQPSAQRQRAIFVARLSALICQIVKIASSLASVLGEDNVSSIVRLLFSAVCHPDSVGIQDSEIGQVEGSASDSATLPRVVSSAFSGACAEAPVKRVCISTIRNLIQTHTHDFDFRKLTAGSSFLQHRDLRRFALATLMLADAGMLNDVLADMHSVDGDDVAPLAPKRAKRSQPSAVDDVGMVSSRPIRSVEEFCASLAVKAARLIDGSHSSDISLAKVLVQTSVSLGWRWHYDSAIVGISACIGLTAGQSRNETAAKFYNEFSPILLPYLMQPANFVRAGARSSEELSLSTFPLLESISDGLRDDNRRILAYTLLSDLLELASRKGSITGTAVSRKAVVAGVLLVIQELSGWVDATEPIERASLICKLYLFILREDPFLLQSGSCDGGPYFGSYVLPSALLERSKDTVIKLMRRWATVDALKAAEWNSPNSPTIPLFFQLFSGVLPGLSASSKLPASTIALTGTLLRPPNRVCEAAVGCIIHLMNGVFPVQSKELLKPAERDRLTVYRNISKRILTLLSDTGSPHLLLHVLRYLREGDQQILFDDVRSSFCKLAASVAPEGPSPVCMLSLCLAVLLAAPPSHGDPICMDGDGTPIQINFHVIRYLVDFLIVPLMLRLKASSLKDVLLGNPFFQNVVALIGTIMSHSSKCTLAFSVAQGPFKERSPNNMMCYAVNVVADFTSSSPSMWDARRTATCYACCLMLHVPFDTLDPDAIKQQYYTTYRIALPDSESMKDQQLNMDICTNSRRIITRAALCRSSSCWWSEDSEKEHLLARQSAFCLLTSSAGKMQSAPRAVFALVFQESTEQQVFANLLDNSAHTFSTESSNGFWEGGLPIFLPDAQANTASLIPQQADRNQSQQAVAFRSNGILSASLMEDEQVDLLESAPPVPTKTQQVTLPSDFFNDNPTMPRLIGIIDLFHVKFDMPPPSGPNRDGPPDFAVLKGSPMPDWMGALHQRIEQATTSLPMRLFIIRVILNRPMIFKAWQERWILPIIRTILELRDLAVRDSTIVGTCCSVVMIMHCAEVPSCGWGNVLSTKSYNISLSVEGCVHANLF